MFRAPFQSSFRPEIIPGYGTACSTFSSIFTIYMNAFSLPSLIPHPLDWCEAALHDAYFPHTDIYVCVMRFSFVFPPKLAYGSQQLQQPKVVHFIII